jgi:ketosteroid isomerase-like protein
MSQENVDRFLDAAAAFDSRDIEAAFEGVHPSAVFEPQATPMEGSFVGRDGVRAFLALVIDLYEVFELHYADVRDLGNRVLALGTARTIATASGVEQEFPLAVVATYQDGLLTHWKDYGDRDRALEAVGLSE